MEVLFIMYCDINLNTQQKHTQFLDKFLLCVVSMI
jgi:hypothetical protein